MSSPGDSGPTVGPDEHGKAGPAWTVTDAGHTARGWPWLVIRKRGGRKVRVTVHGAQADKESLGLAIEAAVASIPDRPGPVLL